MKYELEKEDISLLEKAFVESGLITNQGQDNTSISYMYDLGLLEKKKYHYGISYQGYLFLLEFELSLAHRVKEIIIKLIYESGNKAQWNKEDLEKEIKNEKEIWGVYHLLRFFEARRWITTLGGLGSILPHQVIVHRIGQNIFKDTNLFEEEFFLKFSNKEKEDDSSIEILTQAIEDLKNKFDIIHSAIQTGFAINNSNSDEVKIANELMHSEPFPKNPEYREFLLQSILERTLIRSELGLEVSKMREFLRTNLDKLLAIEGLASLMILIQNSHLL